MLLHDYIGKQEDLFGEIVEYVDDDQTMKIEFNCEDVIRRALEKYGA